MQKARRGLFIVFEGLDRCGKSTQCATLAKTLDDPTTKIAFPNRESESGKLLDSYLKSMRGQTLSNEAVHLLFALNRWEMKSKIIELLESGTNIVCDRYAYSGVAYSAAKVSYSNSYKHVRDLTTIGVLERTKVW